MPTLPGLDDILDAHARLEGRIHRTPVLRSRLIDAACGTAVHFKCESLQKTGSFKVRGVLTHLSRLGGSATRSGVVTVSAGNHAQAVAWAAQAEGIPCLVCMPETAPAAKIEASRGYGAEIRLFPDSHVAFEAALSIADHEGHTFIHPFDHPDIAAGQGTCGLELVEQVERLTDVVVPVGGGGLISGVAPAVRARSPEVRIWGVEPEGAPTMSRALDAGAPVRLERMETIADGLAAPFAGSLPLAVVQECVHAIVQVPDDAIRAAMQLVMSRAKLIVEPAGAAGLAALLCRRIPVTSAASVGVILSGGNMDTDALTTPPDG